MSHLDGHDSHLRKNGGIAEMYLKMPAMPNKVNNCVWCFASSTMIVAFVGRADADMIEQVRNHIANNKDVIRSGEITCTVSRQLFIPLPTIPPDRPPPQPGYQRPRPVPGEDRVNELNQDIEVRKHLLFDFGRQQCKDESTDLRNINQLLLENNLPDIQRINLSQTRSILRGKDMDVALQGSHLLLQPDLNKGILDILSRCEVNTGAISPLLFDESLRGPISTHLQDTQWQGKPVLKITLERKDDTVSIIYADPKLDNRYYRAIQVYIGGILRYEATADDYREVDGIPFPFSQSEIQYARDGSKVAQKSVLFEDVRLNIDIPEDNLTLDVRAGTRVYDSLDLNLDVSDGTKVIGNVSTTIPTDTSINLNNVTLVVAAARAAAQNGRVCSVPADADVTRMVEAIRQSEKPAATIQNHGTDFSTTQPATKPADMSSFAAKDIAPEKGWKLFVVISATLGVLLLIVAIIFKLRPRP